MLVFQDPPPIVRPNILLYGPAKTGKTVAAASAPGPVLYLNADLPNATRMAQIMYPSVNVARVEGLQSLIDAEALLRQQEETGERVIETVVIDTVSDLYRVLLLDRSNDALRPSLPIRGDVSVYVERFCRALCEYDVTTVIVAHEAPVKDESTGQIERLPYCGTTNPALGSKLLGMVDVIGYTGVVVREEGNEYVAQLVTDQGRRGGDRFGVLGKARPMNLTEWVALMRPPETKAAPSPTTKETSNV